MESSKHRSPSVEIPVWLRSHADRPKWVSGVTPSTTCGDVLGSVLRGRGLDLSEHALVEQWRGVERPLPNSARVCQIWSAWGEERERVRFVVKRIRIRSATAAARGTVAAATASGEPVARSRRVRRRNSNGSAASVKQASDTVHPKKIRSKAANDVSSPPTSAMSKNIEDMMKIILSQGKLICEELKQMDHPMAARSYEAGLNKSLASVSSAMPPKKREKSVPNLSTASSSLDESNGDEAASLEQELEDARNLARELSRLYAINEELAASETKMHILSSNLGQLTSERCKALTTAEAEASKMRKVNEAAMSDIARNKELLDGLESNFKEKREAVKRLEYDVNVIEKEGRKLHKEYEKVMKIAIPSADDDDADTLVATEDEQEVIYSELKQLQLGLMKHSSENDASVVENTTSERLATSISPEGSTSGVSSSADESESVVKVMEEERTSNDDSLIVKSHKNNNSSSAVISSSKLMKESRPPEEDSDTGLSSLHSSTSSEDGGVTGVGNPDFGTLV